MINQEKPVLPLSLEGEYAMRDEVLRQLLLEDFVPEPTVDYWPALNRHALEDSERIARDHRADEEVRLGIDKPRKFNALDLVPQERTSRSIYVDDQGEPLFGYIPERVVAERKPAPTWYFLQNYINALDMLGLGVVGCLGEAPILGMPELREVLEVRETMQRNRRIKEATGNYPSAESMGIVATHQTICKDQVVRSTTTTEHTGYDVAHADDTMQTVGKHNAFAASLVAITARQAKEAAEEGYMVMWNAGGSGKHFVVDYTQEAV